MVVPRRSVASDDCDDGEGCAGCGICRGQFCALVRKNALVTRRSKCQLLCEILVPAIILALLGLLRDGEVFEEHDELIPSGDTPLPSWDLLQDYDRHPFVMCHDDNLFLRCGCHDDSNDSWGYWGGATMSETGVTMFSLFHNSDTLHYMCSAADETYRLASSNLDDRCALLKFLLYVCDTGGDITSEVEEVCGEGTHIVDPSASDYLEIIANASAIRGTEEFLDFVIPQNEISNVCQSFFFGVMSSDDGGGSDEAAEFFDFVTSTFPATADRWILYDTESDFEDIITASSYSQESPSDDVIGLSAGIVFSSGSPAWAYTIRVNSTKIVDTEDEYWMANVPTTKRKTMATCRSSYDCQSWTSLYYQSTSLVLQHLIDSWIMSREAVDGTASPTVRLADFPVAAYHDNSGFWEAVGDSFSILVTLSILYPVANVISALVKEKELRIKEGLRMMGLSPAAHIGSWVFHFVCVFFSTSLIMVLASGDLFKFSDPVLIFMYLFLFFMATTAFCFCIAAFFSRSKTGATIGTMIFFASLFPFFALTADGTDADSRRAGCILPATCLALGTLAFVEHEDSEEGVTVDTAGSSEDGFTFNDVLSMLVFDIVLYSFLAWYLGNVVPSEWGTSRMPWFIFTPSYWFPASASRSTLKDSLATLQHFESDSSDSVEPVVGEVKAQVAAGKCVAIRGLTKEFQNTTGGSKVAVNGLDLTMYSGQITALLGHNGAGKTTTIRMLTGMLPVTSGVAFVGGKNVEVDMMRIRKTLGVCPQHDILFPMLTVREHLRMYAVIKGVQCRKLNEVVEAALAEVGLTEKANELTKTLSGGQKRKLSVGIAFIGGSRVVFLDEPTSGMDPHSRRFTWELIRKNRDGRVVVLTTHFMDEADLLGDRVAIMADGALRCCGSSLFLKKLYGVGYNLTIMRTVGKDQSNQKADASEPTTSERHEKENVKQIKRLVASHVPAATLLSNVGAEISFQLPNDVSPAFKGMLFEIDNRKELLNIASYGMSVTTLEEVFLRVANGTAVANRQGATADHDMRRQSSKSLEMRTAATAQIGAGKGAARQPTQDGHDIEKIVFGMHVKALLRKRYLTFKRDKKMWAFIVFMPALFVLIGVLILLSVGDENQPALNLTPMDYNRGDGAPLPYAVECTISNGTCDPPTLLDLIDDPASAQPIPLDLSNTEPDGAVAELNAALLELNNDDNVYGGISFRKADTSALDFDYTVHSNYSALHGAPVYINQINSAILRLASGEDSLSISVTMHPMPQTDAMKNTDTESFTVIMFILMGLSFVPAAWIAYVVREKESKCKYQQVVSGLSLDAYWLSSFVWDLSSLALPLGFILIMLVAFDVEDLISGNAVIATVLLFIFYGLSMPSYTYLWSFLFKRHSIAQNAFLFHNMIMGLIAPLIVRSLNFMDGKAPIIAKVLGYVLSLCPQYALGRGLLHVGLIDDISELDEENHGVLDMRGAGISLLVMGISAVGYFPLLLLLERASAGGSWLSRRSSMLFMTGRLPTIFPRTLGDMGEVDEDVAREAERVRIGGAATDVVRMEGLRKIYPVRSGTKVAVKSTSLGIPKGECFGLLGINGAGKSSTLGMLTGEIPPTIGSVFLANYDVGKNPEKIHRLVGYCPQFDALFETLTGREHLRLYGTIKGIPSKTLEKAVEEKIEEMDLKQYCDRPAGGYSGGNKRKLSVAIAMIGDPQIVFLDEPSTGMDPVARRSMWNVIMRIVTENKECAMILTTHSMDECEALCQRIGIMVGGRLRCLGSSQHLKMRFGKGFQLEVSLAAISEQETDEMVATIAQGTNGEAKFGDSRALTDALVAAGVPELAPEISATGRGVNIFHALSTQRYVIVRDYASWICLEKKCSRVMDFVHQNFQQGVLREKRGPKMRFDFSQQANWSLGDIFGFLEDHRRELSIGEYSLSQTSLEQIFNRFAAQQEEELGRPAGMV